MNETFGFQLSAPQFRDEIFNVSMMFNTDLELFFNLTLNSEGKSLCRLETTCDVTKSCGKNGICPKSETYDIALKYALVFTYNENIILVVQSCRHSPHVATGHLNVGGIYKMFFLFSCTKIL